MKIVLDLKKQRMFRQIIRFSIEQTLIFLRIFGIRIQISGRLNGIEIARTEWCKKGNIPLLSFRKDLNFFIIIANTIYGLFGIKVWIFRYTILKIYLSRLFG